MWLLETVHVCTNTMTLEHRPVMKTFLKTLIEHCIRYFNSWFLLIILLWLGYRWSPEERTHRCCFLLWWRMLPVRTLRLKNWCMSTWSDMLKNSKILLCYQSPLSNVDLRFALFTAHYLHLFLWYSNWKCKELYLVCNKLCQTEHSE